MKGAKEFKERMETDSEFKDKFKGIKNADEAIKIARGNGYDLRNCSLQEEQEITEDMLENVAGGKNDKEITRDIYYVDADGNVLF